MKILITGAFGNIGKSVIVEALTRNHEVTVFEIKNKKTQKEAKKYRKKLNVIFGDIRSPDDAKKALEQADAVIHLAAIIPPASKKHRELTMAVNYGGTVNLINAIKESNRSIPFIFTSSASVMGPTQHQNRPANRNDPLVITGNYEESKIRCEEYLRKEADNYLIFRLAGVLPTFSATSFMAAFPLLEELYDMHQDMRLEMVMSEDVATALVAGVEKLKLGSTPKNQAYILGGGEKNGWQLRGSEFLTTIFGALALQVPDRRYFTQDINNYHLDWYDTSEAQQEFNYQNHTLDDYLKRMKKSFGAYKVPIVLLRPFIAKRLVKMSPYYNQVR
jgi:nucleoside-diphosphate-sugar epimerase